MKQSGGDGMEQRGGDGMGAEGMEWSREGVGLQELRDLNAEFQR